MRNINGMAAKVIIVTIFVLSFLFQGCSSPVQITKNYILNQEMIAKVGTPIARWTTGSHYWEWDNRIYDSRDPSYIKIGRQLPIIKELIYGGIDGKTIRIAYREYIDGYARGDFKQDLTFNYDEKTISFEDLEIQIIKCDSKSLTYIVLSEHSDIKEKKQQD